MSVEVKHIAADAAAGAFSSLPVRKRKTMEGEEDLVDVKFPRTDFPPQSSADLPPTTEEAHLDADAAKKRTTTKAPMTKAREIRLEQNRKAARESRRRKKVMIEELQRSVIFFSRANSTLKQQNEDLSRLLVQAQAHVAQREGGVKAEQPSQQQTQVEQPTQQVQMQQDDQEGFQQAQAQAVATQALFESQGFPAAAARAAAQTMTGSVMAPTPSPAAAPSTSNTLPPMQPGATMQAMANFQQAAAAAMQAAIQGMQGIPGVNMSQLAATPMGANPQQAYTDTMTAIAMQQAAAAAVAGQQFVLQSGMPFMHMAWAQPPQQQDNKNHGVTKQE